MPDEDRLGPEAHWSLVGRGYLWSHRQCARSGAGVGAENLLQCHGNLLTEAWQREAFLLRLTSTS